MKAAFFLWLGLAVGVHAQQAQPLAQMPERIALERQMLDVQRTRIEQSHDEQARACWQKFAVNDCLREVRRSRRAALDPLREQELLLNAQDRAWRTQQRDQRLMDKGDAGEPSR